MTFRTRMITNIHKCFFELVKAGLWEQSSVHGLRFTVHDWETVDWNAVCRLAEEQSVVGLVAAGIDWFRVHDSRFTIPQSVALQFIGQTLQIEQRNKAMNEFVAKLIQKLRENDIYALVVKGQGIAQCYERPLWRSCGDIDLLLSAENYEKAKALLVPLAEDVEEENTFKKHLGMTINGWVVELHGTMRNNLSKRVNKGIDEVQDDIFFRGNVRSWRNGDTMVFLPSVDNDVILVFTHFLNHFFVGGVGLRQICDWCRLLYTYRESLNHDLLEQRIRKMGLMSEWKAFAALAVQQLGFPRESMPLYDGRLRIKAQGLKCLKVVMEAGNFGHNKDNSYHARYSGFRYKLYAFGRRAGEFFKLMRIFPADAPRFFCHYVSHRI